MRLLHTPTVSLTTARDHAGWADFPADLRQALIALVDDSATLESVFGSLLVQGFAVTDILETMRWLDEVGALEEANGSPASTLSREHREQFADQIRLLDEWDSPAGGSALFPTRGLEAQSRVAGTEVAIVGTGSAARRLKQALEDLGMTQVDLVRGDASDARATGGGDARRTPDDPERASVLVYCQDVPELDECLRINALALSLDVPFAAYWPSRSVVEIGPIVEPRQTACVQCYRLHLRAADAEGVEDGSTGGRLGAPIGVDLLALDLLKLVSGVAQPLTRGAVLRLDLLSGRSELHHLLRLPRCPACGVAQDAEPPRRLWADQA